MTSAKRIPMAEITGLYGAWGKRMSHKMPGDVPEPVEVACDPTPLVVPSTT